MVKVSFSFCADRQDYGHVSDSAFMCSFDVVSLFTNVPIDETKQICLDTLCRSDIKPPSISEGVLKKLLLKAMRGVEFSYNNKMYRQKDGVAMGSPLGPVLANIFLGFVNCAFLMISVSVSTEGLLMTRLLFWTPVMVHWRS